MMKEHQCDSRPAGLFEQFSRLNRALHHHHLQNHRLHGPMGDPHRGQGRILRLLKLKPEITQRELAYLLGMRPQSLGELAAKLERSGYLTRTQSETDRRAVTLRLTESGAEAAEAAEANESQPQFSEMFACLSPEEQEILGGYLQRITEALEESLNPDDCHGHPDFREPGRPEHFGHGFRECGGHDRRCRHHHHEDRPRDHRHGRRPGEDLS